jgi:hypothetical protein
MPGMVVGMVKHARVGEKISLVQRKEMASRHFGWLGFLAFIVALLVLARWLL